MSNEQNQSTGPDPRTVLCRVVDVDSAVQNTFKRFIEEEKTSLEDFSSIIREELSKMELFVPTGASTDTETAT
jgi:hypothetical protein